MRQMHCDNDALDDGSSSDGIGTSASEESETPVAAREASLASLTREEQGRQELLQQLDTIPPEQRVNLGPIAIANYARFHKCDPESINLCDVVRSSAGFQGWVEADLSTMILTLSVLSETVEDVRMVSCTNMGGEVVAAIPLAVE